MHQFKKAFKGIGLLLISSMLQRGKLSRKKAFLLLFFFGLTGISHSQDFNWWKNLVHWDGTTFWWKYLTISPKYFGPNALPVPAINNGSIDSNISIGATANFHFSKGDNTQNIIMYGNYTTKKNTISIDMQFVPYERFEMSHAKKEERKVYYQDYYLTHAVGDVIANTSVRLFERWRSDRPLTIRLGLRMPSGGGQGAARYTDAPGYWLDLGWSRPFINAKWKWMGEIGFYIWQTNDDDLRQDDAFLFGTGFEYNKNGFRFQGYATGYIGYKHNGDKPLLLRLNFEKRRKDCIYMLRFQQGLNDFGYSTFEFGMKHIFAWKH